MRTRSWFAVSLAVMMLWPVSAAAQQPAPNPGTKIGEFVSAALNAALPGVGALIQLFKPKGNDNQQKQTADAARKKLMADAAQQLKPLDTLASELTAVERFLSESVPASTRVSRLMGSLDQAAPDESIVKSQWQDCQERLKALGSITDATLENVRDQALRVQLLGVRNLNRDAVADITAAIGRKDWADVRVQLRAVQSSLGAVLAITSVEIARMKTDVTSLVKWANNPAGSVGPTPTAAEQGFLNEAKEALADARKRFPERR
jgi:hypothetical protein